MLKQEEQRQSLLYRDQNAGHENKGPIVEIDLSTSVLNVLREDYATLRRLTFLVAQTAGKCDLNGKNWTDFKLTDKCLDNLASHDWAQTQPINILEKWVGPLLMGEPAKGQILSEYISLAVNQFCKRLIDGDLCRKRIETLRSTLKGSAKEDVLKAAFRFFELQDATEGILWETNALGINLSLIHISEPTRPY